MASWQIWIENSTTVTKTFLWEVAEENLLLQTHIFMYIYMYNNNDSEEYINPVDYINFT